MKKFYIQIHYDQHMTLYLMFSDNGHNYITIYTCDSDFKISTSEAGNQASVSGATGSTSSYDTVGNMIKQTKVILVLK